MESKMHVFETKDDWKDFRKGLFTASQVHRLMTNPRNKSEVLSAGAKTYIEERVAELLAPPEPDYYNSAMEHGNTTEPQAVIAFANAFGFDINADNFIYTSVGGFVFFQNQEYHIGGTPDILIDGAIVEIKCPASKTHLKYSQLKTSEDLMDECSDYYAQMQCNMWLTGKPQGFFVSFDDRYYDTERHLHTILIERDEAFIERMTDKLLTAKEYFNQLINAK